MTLTSAACPLTDVIEDQARDRRSRAWSATSGSTGCGCRRGARSKITEDGREQLRALGFNV